MQLAVNLKTQTTGTDSDSNSLAAGLASERRTQRTERFDYATLYQAMWQLGEKNRLPPAGKSDAREIRKELFTGVLK